MEDLAESNPDSEDAIRAPQSNLDAPNDCDDWPNSPNVSEKDDDDVKDATLDAYKYYAALVNKNRSIHQDGITVPCKGTIPDLIPRLTPDARIVKLIIDLDFALVWRKNDGGAAFKRRRAKEG